MKQLILLLLGLMLMQPATQVFAKDELPFHFSGITAVVSRDDLSRKDLKREGHFGFMLSLI